MTLRAYTPKRCYRCQSGPYPFAYAHRDGEDRPVFRCGGCKAPFIPALVDRLRAVPAYDRSRILDKIAPADLAAWQWDWESWGRPDARDVGALIGTGQLRPPGQHIWWINQGGRGSGKTTSCVHAFADDAYEMGSAFVGVVLCENDEEARTLINDPRSGMRAILPPWKRPEYLPSIEGGMLEFPSGAIARVVSAEKPSKGRSTNFNRWLIDDPPKFGPNAYALFRALLRAFRLQGHGLRAYIATTPPGDPPPRCPELLEHLLEAQFHPEKARDWVYSITASDDNFQNLDADVKRVLAGTEGEAGNEAERGGVYVKDSGARIFSGVDFSAHRVHVLPDHFDDVSISIDPAESANEKACEVGIVVGGVRLDLARGFLLEDASGHYRAEDWPARAWDVAERWAPRTGRWHFLIEDNRGTTGETLLRYEEQKRALIRRPGVVATSICEVRFVTSRKSKGDRARPLPGLYRAGQVGHAAGLELVEGQMRRLTEAERQSIRLDRADAAVYALLDLFGHLDGRAVPLGGSSAPLQVGAFGSSAQSSIAVGPEPGGGPAVLTMAAPGRMAAGAFGRSAW